jgi:uncharacterized protein (DUF4415 family)
MADADIRKYSLDDIRRLNEADAFTPTRRDAPEVELDEAFWKAAEPMLSALGKVSVHLRLDAETADFFRSGGKGHLTRMARVLRAFAQSRRGQ